MAEWSRKRAAIWYTFTFKHTLKNSICTGVKVSLVGSTIMQKPRIWSKPGCLVQSCGKVTGTGLDRLFRTNFRKHQQKRVKSVGEDVSWNKNIFKNHPSRISLLDFPENSTILHSPATLSTDHYASYRSHQLDITRLFQRQTTTNVRKQTLETTRLKDVSFSRKKYFHIRLHWWKKTEQNIFESSPISCHVYPHICIESSWLLVLLAQLLVYLAAFPGLTAAVSNFAACFVGPFQWPSVQSFGTPLS